jgi:hypothetical protein
VIVDSSRSPLYGRLVERIPDLQLDVVHLVRDPRASAFSMQRRKYDPSGRRFMHRAGLVENALLWASWNLAAERLRPRSAARPRYIRIRYEDLAANPGPVLQAIAAFTRLPGDPPPVSDAGLVHLRVNHSAMGNPDRMRSGPTTIKPDLEWARAMSRRDKIVTVMLTWPLMLRHGYRIAA